MSEPLDARPTPIVGPSGTPLTLEDLPSPQTRRWVARRKAEVVTAVRAGLLPIEDACRRYGISVEEFASWERLIDRHGLERAESDPAAGLPAQAGRRSRAAERDPLTACSACAR